MKARLKSGSTNRAYVFCSIIISRILLKGMINALNISNVSTLLFRLVPLSGVFIVEGGDVTLLHHSMCEVVRKVVTLQEIQHPSIFSDLFLSYSNLFNWSVRPPPSEKCQGTFLGVAYVRTQ